MKLPEISEILYRNSWKGKFSNPLDRESKYWMMRCNFCKASYGRHSQYICPDENEDDLTEQDVWDYIERVQKLEGEGK